MQKGSGREKCALGQEELVKMSKSVWNREEDGEKAIFLNFQPHNGSFREIKLLLGSEFKLCFKNGLKRLNFLSKNRFWQGVPARSTFFILTWHKGPARPIPPGVISVSTYVCTLSSMQTIENKCKPWFSYRLVEGAHKHLHRMSESTSSTSSSAQPGLETRPKPPGYFHSTFRFVIIFLYFSDFYLILNESQSRISLIRLSCSLHR